MKKTETQRDGKQQGRVLGRVLAEELAQVWGGYPRPVAGDATAGQTVDPHGHLDLTGGRPGQTDGD
jgi:hypothetical protein